MKTLSTFTKLQRVRVISDRVVTAGEMGSVNRINQDGSAWISLDTPHVDEVHEARLYPSECTALEVRT